eukprot:CAMPEP_0170814088 /NCGR_PEP_ID=MMETSP0733-20121128/37382_1 /TAXON_ID=186038 /ORGANISM="Fragilariopsis kerguelensis, Strain L26-C5" /LENGTH=47 /DNA_ID= /DNA_START= /DNA_END= /DNA_ORIENTATION=
MALRVIIAITPPITLMVVFNKLIIFRYYCTNRVIVINGCIHLPSIII